MSRTRFKRGLAVKLTAFFLTVLLFQGNLGFPASGQEGERDLEGPFKWATMDYQAGKYYDVQRSLVLLLSYYDEMDENIPETAKELKGKIHLLLGATYEKLNSLEMARQQYRLAAEITKKPGISSVDFSDLEVFGTFFRKDKKPVNKGIIARPKKKKKRTSTFLLIAGAALVTGVVAALVLSTKEKGAKQIDVDPNFDSLIGIRWVEIPGGSFQMGDNFNEGAADELPVHTVALETFKVSRHEITFAQFDAFCEETGLTKPSDSGFGRGDKPVINVTYSDARAFCDWLSEKTGKSIHLPTEAQWEFAARGADQRRYPWGNMAPDPGICNFGLNTGETALVHAYESGVSQFGVYNMAGNVAEWCVDGYSDTFYAESQVQDPINAISRDYVGRVRFVVRGGHWAGSAMDIRSAKRDFGWYFQGHTSFSYNDRSDDKTGFRIVSDRRFY